MGNQNCSLAPVGVDDHKRMEPFQLGFPGFGQKKPVSETLVKGTGKSETIIRSSRSTEPSVRRYSSISKFGCDCYGGGQAVPLCHFAVSKWNLFYHGTTGPAITWVLKGAHWSDTKNKKKKNITKGQWTSQIFKKFANRVVPQANNHETPDQCNEGKNLRNANTRSTKKN